MIKNSAMPQQNSPLSIEQLVKQFTKHHSKHRFIRHWSSKAAVAIILQQRQDDVFVLMQKRVERKGDPWSGDMAFPGGKAEKSDKDSWATACRETMEEIGVSLDKAQYLGQLSDMVAVKHQLNGLMLVTPHVCILEGPINCQLNHEVSEVVWIPLSLLMNANQQSIFKKDVGHIKIKFSCYFYGHYKVWGLSLAMLKKLKKIIHKD